MQAIGVEMEVLGVGMVTLADSTGNCTHILRVLQVFPAPKKETWSGLRYVTDTTCEMGGKCKYCSVFDNIFCMIFTLHPKVNSLTPRSFLLIERCQVLPLDVTTPRDSYAWNYRKLTTLLALSVSLADGGLEPLTI